MVKLWLMGACVAIGAAAAWAQTTSSPATPATSTRPTTMPASTQAASQPATAPANTAVIPVGKLEKDFYDFDTRHQAVLDQQAKVKPEIVLIGDSITHMWGGEPQGPNAGAKVFKELFGDRAVLNMGFGYDRTQNVLWRLDHGEMDGCTPKYIIINIGTNNFSATRNARQNTPEEVRDGIAAIIERLEKKSPASKIILMGVFPRGWEAKDGYRPKIVKLNELLAVYVNNHGKGMVFIDLKDKFLSADGSLPKDLVRDSVHPTEKGYQLWADSLKDLIK